MREPANDNGFRPADVKRAIRAAVSAGQTVAAVDFPKQGGFRLLIGEPVKIDLERAANAVNEWDDVLPA
jgi:hypothetical protein